MRWLAFPALLHLCVANLGKLVGGDAAAQQSQSYGEDASSGYCQWMFKIPNLRRNKNPPLAVNK